MLRKTTNRGRVMSGMNRSALALALGAAVVAAASGVARGQIQYSLTNLTAGPSSYYPGSDTSVAFGLNSMHQAVGYGSYSLDGIAAAAPHAFLFDAGNLVDLTTAVNDGNNSQAYGINDNGLVVGYSTPNSTSFSKAFVYDSTTSTYTNLGTLPGGTYHQGLSSARAVNNSGLVVGTSYVNGYNDAEHAFSYDVSTQTMTDLGTLGSDVSSEAVAVSRDGTIVGTSDQLNNYGASSFKQRSFIYSNGTMSDLTTQIDSALLGRNLVASYSSAPAAVVTTPDGTDLVAGNALLGSSYNDLYGSYQTYVYNSFTDTAQIMPNTLGGVSTTVTGMSEDGTLVGWSYDGSSSHAFAAMPGYDGASGTFDDYSNPTMVDLNAVVSLPTGWVLNGAYGVSWNGEIVATAYNAGTQQTNAYLLTPVTSDTVTLAPPNQFGDPQVVDVLGGPAAPGGIEASFLSNYGTFHAYYTASYSESELTGLADVPTFGLPGADGTTQLWELEFTGSSIGDTTTVTFAYDPALLAAGTDESALRIYHYQYGQWVLPDGEVVDTANHTITLTTTSFSPFALGTVAVPEPASLGLLGLGVLGLLRRRWRRPRA